MIYTVKSKWNGKALEWIVLRGAAVCAVKSTQREAQNLVERLREANDPWREYQASRSMR